MHRTLSVLVSFVLLSIPAVNVTAVPTKEINGPQLFVDLSHVIYMANVKQVFHSAQKHPANPVIRKEKPWEFDSSAPTASVIYDEQEKIFKCWYMGRVEFQGKPGSHVLCYAVSTDGIHWERPNLGLYEMNGSTQNNIVIGPDYQEGMTHSESVLKDPLETDPSRRYKALVWSSYDWNGPMSGIYSMTSPDGLHWTHTAEPIFRYRSKTNSVGDAQTLMIDTLQNRYVAALRKMPDRVYSVSKDFVTWTPPEVAMKAMSDEKENTYNNHIGFIYGDRYLGFVTYLHRNANDPLRPKVDVRLLSSSDGLHFEMPGPAPRTRPAFISGGEIGDWDRLTLRLTGAPPIRVGDQLYIYYRGSSKEHLITHEQKWDHVSGDKGEWGSIGLAMLRVDGFASLAAGFDGGEVTTEPVIFDKPVLRLNAKANFGEIFVEVLDRKKKMPICGFTKEDSIPITADSLNQMVTWKNRKDMNELLGQKVRFRFYLHNAHLYSYQTTKD